MSEAGREHFLVSLQSVPARREISTASTSLLQWSRSGVGNSPSAHFDELSIYQLDRLGAQFDHVICSNVLPHVDNLGRALKCLFDATRKFLVVRTLIGDRTFLIRHVHNRDSYSNVSDVEPGDELDENNEPHDFHYFSTSTSRAVVSKVG